MTRCSHKRGRGAALPDIWAERLLVPAPSPGKQPIVQSAHLHMALSPSTETHSLPPSSLKRMERSGTVGKQGGTPSASVVKAVLAKCVHSRDELEGQIPNPSPTCELCFVFLFPLPGFFFFFLILLSESCSLAKPSQGKETTTN